MEKIQTNQRKRIEDLFKLLKQRLNMKEIHKYTSKSVEKTVYLNVFLGALIISQGSTQKQPYNNYSRTKKFRPPPPSLLQKFFGNSSFLTLKINDTP